MAYKKSIIFKIFKFKFIILFLFIQIFSNSLKAQEKLNELLEMDLKDLLSLKVLTATKTPKTIYETPAIVHIITKEEIKENGYFTLEQALSDLPNFQFRNILGFNSYIFIRGIPSQNNLILLLIDGIQMNEINSGGFYGGGHINLENVERIEIVYGPGSSLYGTNAVSGVINIITKDGEKGLKGNLLFGNYNTFLSDFYYGYTSSNGETKFNLALMGKKSEKGDLKGYKGDYMWSNKMENFEDDYSFEGKFSHKNLKIGFLFQDKDASRATI